LCYVGITRAMDHLTLTCARQRMIRGEIQYNRMSRFLQEIPEELLGTSRDQEKSAKPRIAETVRKTAFQEARSSFKAKAFDPKEFKVTKADSLDYGENDRVKHIKFGEGTVEKIVDGGRDF